MDIISYGAASKVSKEESYTRNDVLGQGVEGSYSNVKARVDHLEKAIQGVVEQADNLIVKDTINIMKAHAKLNAIAKTKRYNMHNMVFDDLLDLSGIDGTKSSHYTHDETEGFIQSTSDECVIETKTESIDINSSKIVLIVEEDFYLKKEIIEPMISNVRPIPFVATAHSEYSNNSNKAFRAFDNDDETEFTSHILNSQLPHWIQIDLGESIVANECYLHMGGYGRPGEVWIEASNDEIDWVKLASVDEGNWLIRNSEHIIEFDNNEPYRYYRFIAYENTENRIHIKTMQLYRNHKEIELLGDYSISLDNGESWRRIIPETLHYFKDQSRMENDQIRIKIELPKGVKLLNYALTWA